MKRSKITYSSAGVDYKSIDPLKKLAQNLAKNTSTSSSIKVVEESRGESAFVWEEEDSYKAFVIEGLGTKNLVADEMRKVTGKTYYDLLAQDAVAMIVNDLITVGAKPQVINAYFAAGSSDWFADASRSKNLAEGWANACKLAGVIWGGGESPVLSGVINSETADLAGSAIGIIQPKKRLILGGKIQAGDSIILIESSGVHSNGLSLVRKIAQDLEDGFETKLKNGEYFGEAVLTPTYIYVKVINDLFDKGIDIHYMVNITGHSWRKLMRANREFAYIITQIPQIPQIFTFIQKHSGNDDTQMYGTFNMGAGFAIFLPAKDVKKAQEIIKRNGFESIDGGYLEQGERKVIIKPKNITFEGKTLDLR